MDKAIAPLPYDLQNLICKKVHKLNFEKVKEDIENYKFCLSSTYIRQQDVPYSEWSFCFWQSAYCRRICVNMKAREVRTNHIFQGYYEIVPIYFRDLYTKVAYVRRNVINYNMNKAL